MPSLLPAMQFVSHRSPLLLVDDILVHDSQSITAQLTVRDAPPFGDGEGGVPSYLGLEYMAQTIAALSGLRRRAQNLQPIIGLLVGTRCYSNNTPRFADGDRLTISAREKISEYAELSVFECRIADTRGRTLAEADVKAYQPADIHQYLESHP